MLIVANIFSSLVILLFILVYYTFRVEILCQTFQKNIMCSTNGFNFNQVDKLGDFKEGDIILIAPKKIIIVDDDGNLSERQL
ncbi:hypothetical protein MK852_19300 [Shewanella benthica]|nr:hypothetical protein [Shewanella benthica]